MFVRRIWPTSPFLRTGFPDPARVRRDIDRLFDMLWSESPEAPQPGVFPPMNVTQDSDKYIVRTELPGIDLKSLKVSVERNKLTLAGQREIAAESNDVSYHRRERSGGSFSRSLALPEELDAEKVEARYVDGVLTIELPKVAAAKPRQITVKAG